MDFHREKPKKLYLQIADHLMSQIREGKFSIGNRLPSDRDLAVQMEVSRPAVREALISLELLGVVDMRVGQGTFVVGSPISLEVLRSTQLELASPFELLEARGLVESNVVLLVTEKWQQGTIDKEAYSKTYEITEQMQALIEDGNRIEQFYRLGLAFHKTLAEACGNEVLSKIVSDLVDATGNPLWELVNKKVLEDRAARMDQIREHKYVLSAIERGDSRAATESMNHHLKELSNLALE